MKTIFVPTDFSSSAKNAMTYAAALAKAMKAKLILFHSFQIQTPSPDFPAVTITDVELKKNSEKILEKAAASIRKHYGIKVKAHTQSGFYPSEEIVALTKKLKVDLIVMGMKGKSKIAQVLIGSTAVTVVRNVKTPVMIIPEKIKFIKPTKMLLAFDFSTPVGKDVFSPLRKIAKVFQSEIYVVNVLENREDRAAEKTYSYIRLEKSLRGVKHVYYFPKNKNFEAGIDEFLTKHKAGLMAIVPHKHDLIERLFGKSNTKQMVFHTRIPLLALPDRYARHPTYFI